MASISSATIRYVTEKLQVEDVLKEINYRTETIQRSGNRYRCFCPIHQEEVFRSLTVDADNKTFRCGYNLCKGSRGGNLMELYALATGKSTEDSIEFWAKKLGIDIKYADPAEEKAAEASGGEKKSTSTTTLLKRKAPSGQKATTTGQSKPKGTAPFTRLSQEVTGVFVAPDLNAPTSAERVAEAVKRSQSGEKEKAIEILENLLEIDPHDWDAGMAIARIYNASGMKDQATRVLTLLAHHARESNALERAMVAYSQLADILPEDLACRDALADILKKRGDAEKAAQTLEQAAEIALKQNQKSEAAKRFLAIIEIQPDRARPYECLADIFIQSGRKDQATQVLAQAAKVYEDRELIGKAAERYHQILEINPKHLQAHEALAQISLDRGQQEEAIKHFESVADIYQGEDRIKDAIALYQRVIAIDPANTEIRNRLALIHKHLEETDKATAQYIEIISIYQKKDLIGRAINVARKLLQAEPANFEVREKLIELYTEKDERDRIFEEWRTMAGVAAEGGDGERQRRALEAAVEIRPRDPDANLDLVQLYFESSRENEAIETALRFLNQDIEESDAETLEALLLDRAASDVRVQKYVESRKRADAAAAAAPAAGEAAPQSDYDKAVGCLRDGNGEKALEILEELVSRSPGHADYHLKRSEALLQLERTADALTGMVSAAGLLQRQGLREEAEETLNRALEIASAAKQGDIPVETEVSIHRDLGSLAFERGDFKEASERFQFAADKQPEQAEMHKLVAEACFRNGDKAEARTAWLNAATHFEKQQNLAEAIHSLSHALNLGDPDTDLLERLGDLQSRTNDKSAALRSFRSASELLQKNEDTDSLTRAETLLARIIELDSDDAQAYEDLARVMTARLEATGEKLTPHPATAVYACLADLYQRKGLPGKAQEVIFRALELEPEDEGLKRQLITAYQEAGSTDRAVSIYEEMAESAKESAPERAAEYLEEALQLDPKNLGLYDSLLAIHQMRDAIADVGRTYQRQAAACDEQGLIGRRAAVLEDLRRLYLDKDPAAFKAELMEATEALARIHSDKGEDEKAGAAYVEMVARFTEVDVDPEECLALLRRATELAPTSLRAHQALAELYEDSGHTEEAVRTYLHIDRLAASRRDVRQKEQQQIREECHRAILDIDPERLDSLRALAALFDETENLTEIEEAYTALFKALCRNVESASANEKGALRKEAARVGRRIVKINPRQHQVYHEMGEIYEALEEYEQARDSFFALFNSYRADLPPLDAVERHRDNPARIEQTCVPRFLDIGRRLIDLDGLCDRQVVSPELYELLGDVHRALDQRMEAVQHLAAAVDLYTESGRREEAIAVCRRILGMDSERYEIRLRLSELLESRGLKDEAALERMALAELYEKNGDAAAAVDQLSRVIELAPRDPEPRERVVRIALLQGDKEKAKALVLELGGIEAQEDASESVALARLQEACRIDPSDAELRKQLAAALVRHGRHEDAVREALGTVDLLEKEDRADDALDVLSAIIEADPIDAKLHERRVALLEQRLAGAGKEDRGSIEDDLLDELIRFGRAQLETRHHSEAARAFERALQREADHPEALAGLVAVHEEKEERPALLERLHDLAVALNARNRIEDARDTWQRILKLNPKDTEAAEALSKLSASQDSQQDTVDEILRLAGILSSQGKHDQAARDYRKALEIKQGDRTIMLRLCEALVAGNQGAEAVALRREALEEAARAGKTELALEDAGFILEQEPANLDVRRRVINLHLNRSERQTAVEQCLEAAEQANDPVAAAGFRIRAYEIDPDSWDLFTGAVMSFADNSDKAKALGLCHRRINEALQSKGDAPLEEICRLALRIEPNDSVALATLADQAAALGDLNRAVELHVQLCDNLMAAGRIVEVIEHLLKATKANPHSIELQKMLAERYESVGNYRDATAAYETAARLAEENGDWKTLVELRRALLKLNEHDIETHRRYVGALVHLQDERGEEVVSSTVLNQARLDLLAELLRHPDPGSVSDEIEALAGAIAQADPNNVQAWEAMAESCRNRDPKRAWHAMFEAARLWLDRGEQERARNLYLRLRRSRKIDAARWRELIETLGGVGTEEEAIYDRLYHARAAADEGAYEESADRYLELAGQYPDRLDLHEEMVEVLEKAGRSEENRRTRIHIGDTYITLNETGKAVRWYQSAMRKPLEAGQGDLDPSELPLVEKIAEAWFAGQRVREGVELLLRAGSLLESRRDWDSAEKCYERILAEQSEEAEAHNGRARVLQARGEQRAAAQCLADLASIFRHREQMPKAADAFARALELDDRADLRQSLAETYLEMGNHQQAWTLFRQVAQGQVDAGKAEEAVALYQDLIGRHGQMTQPRQHLSELLLDLNRHDEAYVQLMELARLYVENDLPGKSQESLKRILDSCPTHREAREQLAEIHLDRGQDERAAAEYFALAEQLAEEGQDDEAAVFCDRVLDLTPASEHAQELLVRLLEKDEAKNAARLVDLYANQAQAFLDAGDDEAAEERCDRIEAIQPKAKRAARLRKAIGQERERRKPVYRIEEELARARRFAEEKNRSAAIEIYRGVLEHDPISESAACELADLLLEDGDRNSGAGVLVQCGKTALSQQKVELAQRLAERGRERIPGHPDLLRFLADLRKREKRSVEAAKVLVELAQSMLGEMPDNASPENVEHAVPVLEEARALDSSNLEIPLLLARLQKAAGHQREAAELNAEAAALLAPTSPARAEKLYEESLELYRACREQKTATPETQQAELAALEDFAQFLHHRGSQDSAARILLEAGWLGFSLEKYDKASAAFEKVLKADLSHEMWTAKADAAEGVAEIARTRGQRDRAIEHWRRASELCLSHGTRDRALRDIASILDLNPADRLALERKTELLRGGDDFTEYRDAVTALASVYHNSNQTSKAEALYLSLIEAEIENDVDPAESFNTLVEMYADRGATAEIERVRLRMTRFHHEARRHEDVLKLSEEILTENPQQEEVLRQLLVYGRALGADSRAMEILRANEERLLERDDFETVIQGMWDRLPLEQEREEILTRLSSLYQQAGLVEEGRRRMAEAAAAFDLTGHYNLSAAVYRQLCHLSRNDQRFRHLLCDALIHNRQFHAAADEARKAGEERQNAGDYREAVAFFERALLACQLCPDEEIASLYGELREKHRALAQEFERKTRETDLSEAYRRAERLARDNNLVPACAEYEQILQSYPEEKRALEALAELYTLRVQRGDREMLETTLDLLARVAALREERRDLPGATEAWRTAVQLAPERDDLCFRLADKLWQTGRQEDASNEILERAQRHHEAGRYPQALEAFDYLLGKKSDNPTVLGKKAGTMSAAGDIDGAVEILKAQAKVYVDREIYNRAISVYRGILELKEEDLDARKELIRLLILMGDKPGATQQGRDLLKRALASGDRAAGLAVIRELMDMAPEDPRWHAEAAHLHEEAGEKAEAVLEWWRVYEIYAENELIGKATEAVERILTLDPLSEKASEALLKMHEAKGQPQQAALECVRRARCFREQKQLKKAGSLFERALEFDAELKEALEQGAEVWQALHDYERAGTWKLQLAELRFAEGNGQVSTHLLQEILALGEMVNAVPMERIEQLTGNLVRSLKPEDRGAILEIQEKLAEVYQAKGMADAAAEHYLQLARSYRTAAGNGNGNSNGEAESPEADPAEEVKSND